MKKLNKKQKEILDNWLSDYLKMEKEEMIKQFEYNRNLSELKALSKVSLERPLSDSEYQKLIKLKKVVFGK